MLAVLSTHPIQYQVPLWQALAKDGNVPFEVWYLTDHATRRSFDAGFKQAFAWDLNMLGGYPSQFLKANSNHNVARFSQLRLSECLVDRFRKRNVGALWMQGWQVAAYWQAAWQAHRAGIPVWIRGESHDLNQREPYKRLLRKILLRQLFKRVEYFLYIGQANRRLYEALGVSETQLRPSPYCVDNERFREQAKALWPRRSEIRRQFNIPADAFCILFAGKFLREKRPLDLVEAVAHLNRTQTKRPIHLLWTGSGELGQEIRNRCRIMFEADSATVLSGDVTTNYHLPGASFTGFLNQTEISQAYVAADCLVLPSAGETWGLVVNEAMASGLPCLVSNACGCAEDLVAPIHSDLCFPVGDIAAISRGLTLLLNQNANALAVNAQVQKFDVSVSVETVRQLYWAKK